MYANKPDQGLTCTVNSRYQERNKNIWQHTGGLVLSKAPMAILNPTPSVPRTFWKYAEYIIQV